MSAESVIALFTANIVDLTTFNACVVHGSGFFTCVGLASIHIFCSDFNSF